MTPSTSQEYSEPVYGKVGTCPTCGVLTQRTPVVSHPQQGFGADRCASPACGGLGLWKYDGEYELVYPQAGIRNPPADGLDHREAEIYEEAAAVAPISPRAACALVRVLLEAFLKRHLATQGKLIEGKPLVALIDLAVSDLGLSSSLRAGLTAIRKRGNLAVHDPYGLTDDARADDLPWLFQAVDSLVDELHTNPKKWDELAN